MTTQQKETKATTRALIITVISLSILIGMLFYAVKRHYEKGRIENHSEITNETINDR